MKRHFITTGITFVALSIALGMPQFFVPSAQTANITGSFISLDSRLSGKLPNTNSSSLSLEERVTYQWAIEEVYWRHKLWPAENRQPKPALSDVMPLSLVRARVGDMLSKSNALEQYFNHAITGEQLQAEMERMASQTRQPGLLGELWSALGNDSYVVAECLARPLLVDRLIRNWYGADKPLHRELRARAESELKSYRSPARMKLMSGQYSEAELVKVDAKPSRFEVAGPGADSDQDRLVVRLSPAEWEEATAGLARVFADSDAKRSVDCDSCPTKTVDLANQSFEVKALPVARLSTLQEDVDRFYATAVLSSGDDRVKTATMEWRKTRFDQWWPGVKGQFGEQVQTSAYAFNLPAIALVTCTDDTWKATKALPAGVYGPKAVWTGTEMIIWGGGSTAGGGVNTGARYNPATDTWASMSTENTPTRRNTHSMVWTGTEMIVWGGCSTTTHLCGLSTGGRYNPITDSWRTTTTANAPSARRSHTAVWTGSVMIVWGGCDPGFDGRCPPLNTGGVYNPATDSWTPTSTSSAPSARLGNTAVWGGGVMIIWGGTIDATGGRYNPASDTWTATSTIDVPGGRSGHTAIWTSSEMIVWGGVIGVNGPTFNTGGRYNPTTDIWTPTSTAGAPAARYSHTAVWTGSEMIVWGGWDVGPGIFNTGGRYNPASNTWTTTSTTNAPSERAGHAAVWTGSLMVIWGGASDKTGGRYNPATDSWSPTNSNDTVEARELHAAVWTGTEMIVWSGDAQLSGIPNTGGRYSPATDTWQPTSTTDAPFGRIFPAAVWTGLEMVVWGGQYGSYCFDDGGRYNPTTDTWTVINPVGSPAGRSSLTGVWSGTELIVWGGSCGDTFNTGGRYNPATNSWQPTSTTNAPTARYLHSAVWAGSEMIVWGGVEFGTGVYFNTGGRYNPATNSWQPTSTTGAPAARIGNAAVWTGSEMVVWGGWTYGSPSVYFNTGGRYNPATNSWQPTSSNNAPAARARHTGIWTGSLMIVWGGVSGSSTLSPYFSTGGRYSPATDTWAPTNTSGAPSARDGHSAVWTGSEMIVWGGYAPSTSTYTATGGRYCVTTDPGFNISAAPSSLTLGQGASGTITVTLSSLNGFSSAVSLSCTAAPAGVTWGFAPNPVTPPANGSISSTLTVGVGASVTPGTYSFLVVAASGGLTRNLLVQLSVPPSGDFYVTSYPDSVAASQGGSVTSDPRVWSLNDFSNPVTMSCSGAPAGVTFSFFFNPVTPPPSGSVTNDMTVSVASNVTPGIYNFQLVGTAGSIVRNFSMQLTVLPAGCSYSLSPINSETFTASGGSSSVTVTTSPACSWQAVSNADWITITSGSSGVGTGTVNYTVAPNNGTSARFVRMAIAGQTYQIYQTAASCPFSISPTSHSFTAEGWTGIVSVTAPGSCSWTATSNASWITVVSVSTISGGGAVTYSVAANTAAGQRTGTITIAGQTFTVNQAGTTTTCAYSVSPSEQQVSAQGGSGQVGVSAASGCGWTAASNSLWITNVGPPSGAGAGMITYTVAPNPAGGSRTGTISIGGQTFTVNQSDNPTAADVTVVSATAYDTGVLLEWQTGMEVDNLGFRIYGDEAGNRKLVNPQIIAGSALKAGSGTIMTAGQAYTWWVQAKDVGKDAAFWLEDLDLNGQSTWHGPYFARQVGGKPPTQSRAVLLGSVGLNDSQLATRTVEAVAPLVRLNQPAATKEIDLASSPAIKIGVQQTGWHRVTQAELLNAGLDTKADPRNLRLFVDGRELPIFVAGEDDGRFDSTDAVEFYGLGLDTPSANTSVYWLVAGAQPGLRIAKAFQSKGLSWRDSFPYTAERRDKTVYFSALRNGDAENFFGAVITSSPVNQSLTLKSPAPNAPGEVILEVSLQGVTTSAHHVAVNLNNSFAGYVIFSGQTRGVEKFSLPQSLVHAGPNTVTLQSQGGPGDVSLVDAIRLTYQHSFAADDDLLSLTAQGGETVTITGFSSKDVRVFDVTAERNVQELTAGIDSAKDGVSATVTASGAGERRLLALTGANARRAATVKANSPSHLRDAVNAADLIVITDIGLLDSLRPLVDLRSREGLISALIDVEDVYDEFNFGHKSPQAIKDFLSHAKSNWKRAPRFVLFAGDATVDPKNYLGSGYNDLVPTRLIDTDFLETASDDWFADFDNDGVSEMAVGRLPVRDVEEAVVIVSKLVYYSKSKTSNTVALVSDANDGFNFEQASAQLRPLFPPTLKVEEIRRGELDPATAKARLVEAINRGQKLVNYIGHGNANQWRGDLLTSADASALTNGDRLPVFVMMTCLNGYFHDAAVDSLAESLIKAEHGGAIAVWASSGMTFPEQQSSINQQLYRMLFSPAKGSGKDTAAVTLGEAIRQAKSAVANSDIRRTWILLGDPTMRLR